MPVIKSASVKEEKQQQDLQCLYLIFFKLFLFGCPGSLLFHGLSLVAVHGLLTAVASDAEHRLQGKWAQWLYHVGSRVWAQSW